MSGTEELRCWAEIDLDALASNLATCRKAAGGAKILSVVKADAYGHGLETVAQALAGVTDWFGVANLAEARRIRAAGDLATPVLLLGPALPAETEAVVAEGFSASVSDPEELDRFAAAAERLGTRAKVHAIADTGMGRIGALPEAFGELVRRARTSSRCLLEGVATHFPSADEDAAFTREQIGAFRALVDGSEAEAGCLVHLANSAGLLGFGGEIDYAGLARPGLALYGASPLPAADCGLVPAMSLKSRLLLVRRLPAGASVSYGRTFVATRPMLVGTVALGYADGYRRSLSGQGAEVLVRSRRCPLLGRVTMDQIVVDLSALEEEPPRPGEEVVLFGRQGEETIPLWEVSEKAGTIPWEILAGIGSRVARRYCRGASAAPVS